jgi:hypothetical protein
VIEKEIDNEQHFRERPPKTKFLSETEKAFQRLIFHDKATRPYVAMYCYALLDRLRVRRHPFLEDLKREIQRLPPENRKSFQIPTADQEEALLQALSAKVREQHSRFHEVFGEHLPNQLRRITCFLLADGARDTQSSNILWNAGMAIRLTFERLWDNPVRFHPDPVNGQRTAEITATMLMPHIMEASTFLRALEPARKPGRNKGCEKPKHSGRKSVEDETLLKAYLWKQKIGNYKPVPWWVSFGREIAHKIPNDPKGREAFRTKMNQWALKGATILSTARFKKVGGLKPTSL